MGKLSIKSQEKNDVIEQLLKREEGVAGSVHSLTLKSSKSISLTKESYK
jgi:hypothetical protein